MSKAALASRETIITIVEELIEISKLDTLFSDLYLQRARALLGTFFSMGSYLQLKENKAEIPWVEKQLRAGVERNDWKRCTELTERLRKLREKTAGDLSTRQSRKRFTSEPATFQLTRFHRA